MYDINASSSSDIRLDTQMQQDLQSTARWGRFLAIVGFIMTGLLVFLSFFIGAIFNIASHQGGNELTGLSGINSTFITAMYLIIAVVYFFPCYYLYQFSSKMIRALPMRDEPLLKNSFQQLKNLFRFMGIITILMLSLWALSFFAAIAGGLSHLVR